MRARHNITFEEAIQLTPRYLENGRYYKHLQRYLSHFDKDQLHIILFDDLKADPQSVYDSICDFLMISRFQLDVDNLLRPNVGGIAKSAFVGTMINKLYKSRNYLRQTPVAALVDNRFVDSYSRIIRNRIASWNYVRGTLSTILPNYLPTSGAVSYLSYAVTTKNWQI